MSEGPSNTNRLLNPESVEEEGNEGTSQQPDAPPPYHIAVGGPSILAQTVAGQNLAGNPHAPMSGQPVPIMFYGYPQFQPAPGQLPFPGGVSVLPSAQPLYFMQAPAPLATSNQPLIDSQCQTSQHRPRTERRNTRAPRRNMAHEPDLDEDSSDGMGGRAVCFTLWSVFLLVIFVLLLGGIK